MIANRNHHHIGSVGTACKASRRQVVDLPPLFAVYCCYVYQYGSYPPNYLYLVINVRSFLPGEPALATPCQLLGRYSKYIPSHTQGGRYSTLRVGQSQSMIPSVSNNWLTALCTTAVPCSNVSSLCSRDQYCSISRGSAFNVPCSVPDVARFNCIPY